MSGIDVILLQLDDYFYLPPADNHAARLANLAHVGVREVNMPLLQQHLNAFTDKISEIEHQIVVESAKNAHFVIGKDYTMQVAQS